jgi:8-oxo-dGTP pyrophosphatase MutT (NUDIX family)
MKLITDPDAARAVVPRAASTTLIVRDASPGRLELLMVRRSMHASFMPGAYVFPGGAVDAADGAAESVALCDESAQRLAERVGRVCEVGAQAAGFAVAALREYFEECGLWLGAPAGEALAAQRHPPLAGLSHPPLAALRHRLHAGEPMATLAREAGWPLATSALTPWSHWVTPLGLPKRFDTLFFIAEAPAGQEPSVDEGETTTLAWVHPPEALAAQARGEFQMEFATVSTVRSLVPFARQGVAALRAHAAAQRHLPALHPRLQLDADGKRTAILLPGQPGYEEATLR